MESSYATSNEMQSSVAVGTAERGLSHPSLFLAWELFNFCVAELIICYICSISTVKFYTRLWRFRGLICASSHLLRCMHNASLATCIPSSQ
jgi:hypothetical protein